MIGLDAPSFKLIDEIIKIKKSYQATHPAGVRGMTILFHRKAGGKMEAARGEAAFAPEDQRRESSAAAR
jgi:hypothetical protein